MDNNSCEKLILNYAEQKLKTHEAKQNIDMLHTVDVNYNYNKMNMLMFPVNFEGESSYVARGSAGGKNSPDVNYIDKNSDWFSFTKPVIYGGFEYKLSALGELIQKPKTKRPYRQFREGDLLTIWQTLGAGGAEHLLCVIVHKGQLYSFGFGYQGLGEKQQAYPKIPSIFSKFVHLVDVHPGSIYTPDYLFEMRMYDQIVKKRSQVKLIANSFLMSHHLEAMRKDFDQIDFYKDERNISKISCRLLSGNIFSKPFFGGNKALEEMATYLLYLVNNELKPALEDQNQVEAAAYLINSFISSAVQINTQIKLDETTKKDFFEKVINLLKFITVYETKVSDTQKPYFDEMKSSLQQNLVDLQKADSNDESPRLLCYIKYLLYVPSASYCEFSRDASASKNLANCASFMYRFFGDILTCSGSSLVFHPKHCKQSESSVKSNCNVSPFA